MTATDKLRALLDERGVEWWNETDPEPQRVTMARTGEQLTAYYENANGSIGYHVYNMHDLVPEQAIAATLGDYRLAFLEGKVNLQGDYIDKLTKEKNVLFAQNCEAATRHAGQMDAMQRKLEAATLGGQPARLTAEQLRELIAPHLHARPTFDFGRHGAVWSADFQAIADALNVTLGRGTCEYVIEDNMNETDGMGDVWFRCTNCDTSYDYYADEWLLKMPYCPHCGCEVK